MENRPTKPRSRITNYSHTISGLLNKRIELIFSAEEARGKLAETKNDILAIDRILRSLGYKGDLNAAMPLWKRKNIFAKGELMRSILSILKTADKGLTGKDLAKTIALDRGDDTNDKEHITKLSVSVLNSLRSLKKSDIVESTSGIGKITVWQIKR